MDKEQFGQLLTTLRKKQGMSQKELANLLSVSTSAVSKWEHGKNLPDMMMFASIAEVFHVSCDALHNPEETLKKLENPDYNMETEEKSVVEANSEKKKRRIITAIAIMTTIVCVAMSIIYQLIPHEPNYQEVATRYFDDPIWGRVYHIAYVVDVEPTNEMINVHLEEIREQIKQKGGVGTDTVKTSYYRKLDEALEWKEIELFGYVFLDVE